MSELVTMDPRQILALPMGDNDAGADTIRGYLIELLAAVWREGEGFSGKRPFGNSSWEWELYRPLVRANVIAGSFCDADECCGYCLEEPDWDAGDKLIAAAIAELGKA